ncbi:MAG: hypothetical protein ACETWT_15800 [Thermodesulfobacteriota bacterium]
MLYRDPDRPGRDTKIINHQCIGEKGIALAWKREIRLEFASNSVYIGHRKKYDRVLAYAYPMDGAFLNPG